MARVGNEAFTSVYFSIILPTYNRATQLPTTIQAVLSQTEPNFELIIIDDGSTDESWEAVQPYLQDSRVKYHHQPNQERGAARNNGASLARGFYLNFFDSDDLMYENHLESAKEFIRAKGELEFFHTSYRVVGDDDTIILQELGEDIEHSAKRLIETNYLSCNSVFCKRDFFLKTKFNPDRRLASAEDWDLWLKLISRTPLQRCSRVTFQINNHSGRSLLNITPERIAERDQVLLDSLLNDAPFVAKFNKELKLFEANLYAFSALAFSVTRKRKLQTIRYLTKAVKASFFILSRRRFWAAMKHLISS